VLQMLQCNLLLHNFRNGLFSLSLVSFQSHLMCSGASEAEKCLLHLFCAFEKSVPVRKNTNNLLKWRRLIGW
jgi:hypothetical protein